MIIIFSQRAVITANQLGELGTANREAPATHNRHHSHVTSEIWRNFRRNYWKSNLLCYGEIWLSYIVEAMNVTMVERGHKLSNVRDRARG